MKITVAVVSALIVMVLVLPIAGSLLASVPAVQTLATKKLMAHLSERLGTRVAIDRVEIKLINRVEVEGFYVEDFRGDTLLYVPKLVAPVIEWGLLGEPLTFGRVRLENAQMWIRRDSTGVVNIRELVTAIRGGKPKNPDPKFRMHIVGIQADSITFGLLRDDRPPRAQGVDFSRFVIHNTLVGIEDFAIDGPQVKMRIDRLAFEERSGFDIKDFSARELLVSRGEVALTGVEVFDIHAPHIRLVSPDSDWKDYRNFADSVMLDIAVRNSRLTTDFLGLFISAAAPLGMTLEGVSAHIQGPLAALAGGIEGLRTGTGTSLSMDFTSRGLPDLKSAHLEGNIAHLAITGSDLGPFFAPMTNLGEANFTGTFAGDVLQMAIDGVLDFTDYRNGGAAASGNFTVAGAITDGRTVTGTANGELSSLTFRGHTYNNIALEGKLEGGMDGVSNFTASLSAHNPWRYLGLDGNLTAQVSGSGANLEGSAQLLDAVYTSANGIVSTPLVSVAGHLTRNEKALTLNSEFADADLRGDTEELIVMLAIKDADPLLAALVGKAQIAEGSRAQLKASNSLDNFSLAVQSDFIEFGSTLMTDIRLSADRSANSLNVLLSGTDLYSGSFHLPDFKLFGRAAEREMALSLDGQKWLTATGTLGGQTTDTLRVRLDNFDLSPLGHVLKGGVTGRGTGYVEVTSVLQNPRIAADLTIEELDAAMLNPLLSNVLENTSGMADAHLLAKGSLKDLRIDGTIDLPQLETTLKYTGATYSLTDSHITIVDSRAELSPTTLHDPNGGTAEMTASVDLREPQNPSIEIDATLNSLLALNTGEGANESFYGQVTASGSLQVRSGRMGTQLDIQARTNTGTEIHLPLNAKSNISWSDFVVFTGPQGAPPDTTNVLERKRQLYERQSNTGTARRRPLDMNLTIDVTPEAEVHLLIDPRLGRGIMARGEGVIGLGINPATNLFTMTGDYAISEGRMEFSMMDVISKNFTIAPGSTLRWSGAPDDALLDVRALYRVRTSLTPLIGEGNPLISGRSSIPVDCVLELHDNLSAPGITFDIDLPSADPDARLVANNAMNTQELKSMQFLSLLMTGSFASGNSITGVGSASSGALANGAVGFDILTSSLSNFLSSEDYDIYFRYRPQDNFTNNRFDVGFSTGFVDDRLMLTIEGNYIDDRSAASVGTGNVSNLAGDVSLTWVIDKAGNLRLKAFSQTIDRLNETQGLQESGLGVYYKKDFNRLSDVFRRKKLNLRTKKTN